MSFIGIFLTFYWFDFPFDQGGYTSFLLLSGIVVNSLILIFSDYYRYLKAYPWRAPIDMYLRAYRSKITPITLTVLSTALGLLPFTMHGAQEVFWFSLAIGTIGGLTFSLILIIFFVPLFIKKNRARQT
jgi:multidrug efflux pump subunit AcrB